MREADERWLCILFGESYEAKFQSGGVHVYGGNGDEIPIYTAGMGWHEKKLKAKRKYTGLFEGSLLCGYQNYREKGCSYIIFLLVNGRFSIWYD